MRKNDLEEIWIMNWSDPNKSENSEEKSFIYIMLKKFLKLKNIVDIPLIWFINIFDDLPCLFNV